jgi:hypothetical protein
VGRSAIDADAARRRCEENGREDQGEEAFEFLHVARMVAI